MALEIPMYRLFSDGDYMGNSGKDARYLNKPRRVLSKTDEEGRNLVMFMVQKMAHR